MNINKAVDKAFESKSMKEISKAPVNALQGISEGNAKHLKEAFGVDTIEELDNLKCVKWLKQSLL